MHLHVYLSLFRSAAEVSYYQNAVAHCFPMCVHFRWDSRVGLGNGRSCCTEQTNDSKEKTCPWRSNCRCTRPHFHRWPSHHAQTRTAFCRASHRWIYDFGYYVILQSRHVDFNELWWISFFVNDFERGLKIWPSPLSTTKAFFSSRETFDVLDFFTNRYSSSEYPMAISRMP